MKPSRIHLAQFAVVLLCAAALKLYYSTASVNDLLWILAPTSFLVELITGVSFTFESYAGYMSSDHSFLIAASCSGVNFLIAAFLMLSFERLWRGRTQNIGWQFIPVALAVSYLTTIIANTVRIMTALELRHVDADLVWLNPDQLHRFEGIFVYFGFLLLLFVISEKVSSRKEASRSKAAYHMLRRFLLPLTIYYGTTLGLPLANGAYQQGFVFLEHSLFVILIPILVTILLAIPLYFRDQQLRRSSLPTNGSRL
jgi:exosortase K